MKDVHQITRHAKERFPGLSVVLIGHSMGSMVVRCYMRLYDGDIDGLIVCGSPSRNPMAKFGKTIVTLTKKSKAHDIVAHLSKKWRSAPLTVILTNPVSENAWICSDSTVIREYDNDPQCGFTFTLNEFEALFNLMIRIYQPSRWA